MQRLVDLFLGHFLFRKEFFHQSLVGLGNGFQEHIAVFRRFFPERRGNLADLFAASVEEARFHICQVQKPDDFIVFQNRNQNRADTDAELLAQLVKYAAETRFGVVALVDEKCARQFRVRSIIPCKLRADLNACFCVDNNHSASGNAQRLLDLADKIKVAGGVEQIDLFLLPFDQCQRGGNGKASFQFFIIIIADCIFIADLSQSVCSLGKVEHGFCQRGLSVRAVADQANIADVSGFVVFHCVQSPLIVGYGCAK